MAQDVMAFFIADSLWWTGCMRNYFAWEAKVVPQVLIDTLPIMFPNTPHHM